MRLQPSVLAALRGSVLGTSLLVGCGASQGTATTTQESRPVTNANTNTTEVETASSETTTTNESTSSNESTTETSAVTPVENSPPPCGRG